MSFNCFMHERNIYKDRPNFSEIAIHYPELRHYALPDKKGKFRIDFNDPNALRTLTKILLKKDFNLSVEIPDGYLIPTVPQRLNYILWMEDLLTAFPKERGGISGIDIGTGPCAILSLLGSKKNGWNFISTETADEAVQWAKKNIENNDLDSYIKVSKVNKGTVLQDVMVENEVNFDFCVCNPPFFENKDDIRKKSPRMKERLNLFAKKEEIFSDGGEVAFVKQMLKDSLIFKNRISLYSSMFGKKKSFIEILKELQGVEGITYTKTEFCQGNTIRWGIAWTFVKDVNFEKIQRPKPVKPKKPKPPLTHSIMRKQKDGNLIFLQDILKLIKSTLLGLQIQTKIIKSVGNYAEIEILSYENTWSHQRRKRREQQKGSGQEVDKKIKGKDEAFSTACVSKPDLSDVACEKSPPNSSKDLLYSAVSLTDLEPGQAVKIESGSCLLSEKSEEQRNQQKTKTDAAQETNTKIESAELLHNPQVSVPQKRKRDKDEPTLSTNSDMLPNQGTECALEKNSDIGASPGAKKLKISEDATLSNEDERRSQCDTFSKETICLTESQSHQEEIGMNLEAVQTNPLKTFETIPLLYSILKLRTTKENILLEMNCPPEFNRETMHQVFQLFKNKFSQYY